jgi:hypothetical protein
MRALALIGALFLVSAFGLIAADSGRAYDTAAGALLADGMMTLYRWWKLRKEER